MDRIGLDWRSAADERLGPENRVTRDQIAALAPEIARITRQMAEDRAAGKLPYRDLPYQSKMMADIKRQVRAFRDRCDVLVVLGIGGSALGNIALQAALNPPTYNLDRQRGGPMLFVLDNVDPDLIRSVTELIGPRLKRTIVNVISKSGETAETAAQFIYFRDLLRKRLGARYKDNILATTDPQGGTLRGICQAEGFATLEVPPGVGGRFSVLSAVGLFSAAMCGIKVDQLMAGAADMDQRVKSEDPLANPAAVIAAIHHLLNLRGKSISVMMSYSSGLYLLADWYRQLWAESLGKQHGNRQRDVFAGQTPVKALGATDQHSQVQLYREGPNDKVFTFLEVGKFGAKVRIPTSMKHVPEVAYLAGSDFQTLLNAEKLATEYALLESRRPSITVRFPRINAHTVGQFLYLYEVATSYMGGLLDINTYDQPGVELGKKATFALMGRKGYEETAARIRPLAQRDPDFLV